MSATSSEQSGSTSPTQDRRIRVLIVDDSSVVRQVLTRELSADPAIEVVGTAPDPYVARDKILQLKPDVLTLDVEMPRMDGVTFLRALSKHHPMPVIMVSSMTAAGTQTTIDALAAGAIDVVCKPGSAYRADGLGSILIEKIKQAARAKPRFVEREPATPVRPAKTLVATTPAGPGIKLFALGASTGGVQALTELITALPADAPATVIVQHMPEKFTRSFADRLDRESHMTVREAADGDALYPGLALLAPGGRHMALKHDAASGRLIVVLRDGPAVHHQRPAVDVLFQSIARCAARDTAGAILTGMGADGAAGLLAMRNAGARTIAQDEATSVVYGMPGEAARCGAAEQILPLGSIAGALMRIARPAANAAA
jgi:two-component system chemotaxis response regulator CheB